MPRITCTVTAPSFRRVYTFRAASLEHWDPTEPLEQALSEGNAEPAVLTEEREDRLAGYLDVCVGVDAEGEVQHARYAFVAEVES